jgi:hypothetical protein
MFFFFTSTSLAKFLPTSLEEFLLELEEDISSYGADSIFSKKKIMNFEMSLKKLLKKVTMKEECISMFILYTF